MSSLKGRVTSAKTVRLSLAVVLVLALAAVLAVSASAQAAPSKVSFDVPHGQFAAYSMYYAGDGKKVNIKMTYSPLDPADEGKPNAESVILNVYSPKNPAPKGPAIGAAGGTKGTKNFQLESNVAGNYTLVVHNWNSQKKTVSVTLETTFVATGAAGPALTAVSGAAMPAATAKAPTANIDIVAVTANASDPNVIVKTLADGKTTVRMYTNGLDNVPVDVPVVLKAEAPGATSYAWTLTGPTASKAALDKKDAATVKFTPDVAGVYKVDLVASNAAGSSPMASVQIHAGTYIGVQAGGCVNCHPKQVKEWEETGHGVIFEEEIQGGADPKTSHYNEGCLRCHTTGYFVGAKNGGFTDVQAQLGWKFPALEDIQAGKVKFENLPAALKNMANIQCEVCHGPAAEHVKNQAPMAIPTTETCNTCHDGGGHHTRGTELANSKHSHEESQAWTYPTGPARQDCVNCHSGEGFITFTKNPTEKASWANTAEPLGCTSCHDSHGNGKPFQLRVVGKGLALPGKIDKDFGLSGTCVNCHNARTTGADAVKGSTPHYSAAAEMLANTGGVTYGKQVVDSPHGILVGASPMKDPAGETPDAMLFGGNVPGPCVACHMYPQPADAKDPNHFTVGQHSFNVVSPDGKFDYTAPCVSCHPAAKDFKFGAKADYDGNGKVETVQAEVAGLLNLLQKAINDSGIRSVQGHPYFDRNDTAKANDKQRNAIYNYLFVRGLEGTDGKAAAIHNFNRAVSLLQLSYKDLTGNDVPGATLLVK